MCEILKENEVNVNYKEYDKILESDKREVGNMDARNDYIPRHLFHNKTQKDFLINLAAI